MRKAPAAMINSGHKFQSVSNHCWASQHVQSCFVHCSAAIGYEPFLDSVRELKLKTCAKNLVHFLKRMRRWAVPILKWRFSSTNHVGAVKIWNWWRVCVCEDSRGWRTGENFSQRRRRDSSFCAFHSIFDHWLIDFVFSQSKNQVWPTIVVSDIWLSALFTFVTLFLSLSSDKTISSHPDKFLLSSLFKIDFFFILPFCAHAFICFSGSLPPCSKHLCPAHAALCVLSFPAHFGPALRLDCPSRHTLRSPSSFSPSSLFFIQFPLLLLWWQENSVCSTHSRLHCIQVTLPPSFLLPLFPSAALRLLGSFFPPPFLAGFRVVSPDFRTAFARRFSYEFLLRWRRDAKGAIHHPLTLPLTSLFRLWPWLTKDDLWDSPQPSFCLLRPVSPLTSSSFSLCIAASVTLHLQPCVDQVFSCFR